MEVGDDESTPSFCDLNLNDDHGDYNIYCNYGMTVGIVTNYICIIMVIVIHHTFWLLRFHNGLERSSMLFMGKLTISTGPFSVAMSNHRRVILEVLAYDIAKPMPCVAAENRPKYEIWHRHHECSILVGIN